MLQLPVFLIAVCSAAALNHPDEIGSLPGLTFPLNYKHYSGYLNASEGKFLHYWFVESQRSPTTDPVLLWMNGGPGCSSLDGFLGELGPLHVADDGKTLLNNPYAWNKEASVIFLEAPAGVGFSYSLDKDYSTDDDAVSLDNYLALQHFYIKFPQFRKNHLYITGESYGGVYVPTLALRVMQGGADIHLRGFGIGNGYLDKRNLTNSLIFFAYYHGLLGSTLWDKLKTYCCGGIGAPEYCNFYDHISAQCADAVSQVTEIVENPGLDMYNLYDRCMDASVENSRYLVDKRNVLRLLPRSHKLRTSNADPSCTDPRVFVTYLNQPAVRKALHIPDHVQDWDQCSLEVENGYKMLYDTMAPHFHQLLDDGKLIGLIYNGDVDMVCNFLGDEWFADSLGFHLVDTYKVFNYSGHVAGFMKHWDNLVFLTFKGAGHMVPGDQPGPALHMINRFLSFYERGFF